MIVLIFLGSLAVVNVCSALINPFVKNVVHLEAPEAPPGVSGVWKTRVLWKPRWLKEWKTEIKPVWKKVWGPVQIHEWVPVPKPPPNYNESTPLELISSTWEPDVTWKPTDSEFLLNSYHTIQDGNTTEGHDLGTNESTYPTPRPYSEYAVGSADPEAASQKAELPDFLQPPRINNRPGGFLEPSILLKEIHSTEEVNKTDPLKISLEVPRRKEVSPYASSLATAVLQEKLNQSHNVTRPTAALTQALFPVSSSKPTASSSTSTPPSPVFIVTPVTSGK